MPSTPRIVMLGTGDFALPTFLHLHATGHNVVALITQPDKPQGRKQELIPSPIKMAAVERGIPVYQPDDVNAPAFLEIVRSLGAELIVTAAYGQILSADLLALPRLKGINLHGSILPAYRGAAPVARAIERGETETGVTVILMTPRIDAGGMLKFARTPIEPDETAGALEARLAQLGAPLVVEAISELESGTAKILPQDRAKVTKAPKLRKEDGLIDWSKPARAIHNLVRAMQPWPMAFTSFRAPPDPSVEPIRLIVHKTRVEALASAQPPGSVVEAEADRFVVAAGDGAVQLLTVQIPGKKSLPAVEFLRGYAERLRGQVLIPGRDLSTRDAKDPGPRSQDSPVEPKPERNAPLQEWKALPDATPHALLPHLEIGQPNEAICLYNGTIGFTKSGKTVHADGNISHTWLPSPTVRFQVSPAPLGINFNDPWFDSLLLGDGTSTGRAFFTRYSSPFGSTGSSSVLAGIIGEPVLRLFHPADDSTKHVMFLIPNFDELIGRSVRYGDRNVKAGRLILKWDGWTITLDDVDQKDEILQSLGANSGFGLTQIGRLDKEDGTSFSAKQALSILEALTCYLSFAEGRWTAPCLPTGFDGDGEKVWESWNNPRIAAFRRRTHWLDRNHHDQFELPFTGFADKWNDEAWKQVIGFAIHWYVEANAHAGSVEGSIVMTQTAFEVLAAAVLADHHGWLSQETYEKLPAADRIRLLLLWAGVPTGIPKELKALVRLAKANEEFMVNKHPDAGAAMATIRNTITHPTNKNRKKYRDHTDAARMDVLALGLRNLELCLLRLFRYSGKYADRLSQKWRGEVTQVPWAPETGTS